ncbi:MAG TPA: ABC transporter permease [Thermomicrobiaceae bacterium]|nr:ABC transporter permease [Thermomicrobiaceae bacterium]
MAVGRHMEAQETLAEAGGRQRVENRSPYRDAWRRLSKNKMALASIVIIGLFLFLAIFANVLAPYSYQHQNLLEIYQGPSHAHWLGTDALGRDMLSRLLYGSRISMSVALVTVIIVVLIGVPVGLISGYYGGVIDTLLMRVVDIGYAFPSLLLIIILSTYLGAELPRIKGGPLLLLKDGYNATGGLVAVIIALAIFGWLSLSRLVRGQVLTLKQQEFIEGARGIGASNKRIMFQHLLPNSLAPVIIAAALYVPSFIIAEAGLSFIGLGVKPPTPSWGIMIADGVQAIQSHPYVPLEPGLAIALLLLAFNFLGDGLRDALDPFMNT